MDFPPCPDLNDRTALRAHVRHTLGFYHPRAFDPSGGFFQYLKDDGRVCDRQTRHLVSSTRYVFLWAMAARHFPGEPVFLDHTHHALAFLTHAHRRADGGYRWLLRWDGHAAHELDPTNHCYGLAFVLLAQAHALMAGVKAARTGLVETFALMERRFWEPQHGLYADDADANWQLSAYRGQNANMHAVEACLAAFDATGHAQYLDRAAQIASGIAQGRAALTGELVWEHHHADWQPDWDYNRDDRSNIFRPWGYQPGHWAEWARLLVLLEQRRGAAWMLPCAQALLAAALRHGWDAEHGGLVYSLTPELHWHDAGKYHWVQAETLAACALLARRTGEDDWYRWSETLWAYCWRHWVDHRHGAWFRILARDHAQVTDDKCNAGKVDYHTTGAIYDVIKAL